jgi:hypothetical protein
MAIMGGNVGIGTTSPGAKLDVEIGYGEGGAAIIGSSGNLATGDFAIAMGSSAKALGDNSIAMGSFAQALGPDSIAMGRGTTASGISSTAIGYHTVALGTESFSMGYETTAKGHISFASGQDTNAYGQVSTSMGRNTNASGYCSTAIGGWTNASGDYSTSMGRDITADGDYSLGIGLDENPDKWTIAQDNTMAIMGGNVGIGTVSPDEKLEVQADSDDGQIRLSRQSNPDEQLLLGFHSGDYGFAQACEQGVGWRNLVLNPSGGNVGIGVVSPAEKLEVHGNVKATRFIGDGSKLTGIPTSPWKRYVKDIYYIGGDVGIGTKTPRAKLDVDVAVSKWRGAAIIGGGDISATGHVAIAMGVNTDAYGDRSIAMGTDTSARGYASTAMGDSTKAKGEVSTAMGYKTVAFEDYSTAMGWKTNASGQSSVAMGRETTASGFASTAMGCYTTASSGGSTAMGYTTIAYGTRSTAMGYDTNASGYASTAMGSNTNAKGMYSTAMGYKTNASGDYSTAMGRYMIVDGKGSFGIGLKPTLIYPGEWKITQDNTMAIMGGNVGIGTVSPHHLLDLGDSLGRKLAVYQNAVRTDFYGFGISHGKLEIHAGNSGPEPPKMVVKSDGKVGIGTTNPSLPLHVIGRIGLTDVPVWIGTDDNDLNWDGLTISREGSSIRYKQNILPLQEDFRKILRLQPKQYQMREGYGDPGKWSYGYIAEEVEQAGLTKLVIHDAEGRPDGIKYKKMGIYLLEIVKDHDQEIAKLKNQISRMEGESSLQSISERNGNVGIGTTTPTSPLHVVGLPVYANNAAAVAGGLTPGAFYRTGGDPDLVCVVH